MPPTLLLVGLGELGSSVLEQLVRVPNLPCRIVATDIQEDAGARKVNSAVHGASYCDLYPAVAFRRLDVSDIEATAALLRAEQPSLVFHAATLASWWVRSLLPREIHDQLYTVGAGAGAWISMHLTLAAKLVRAVRDSGVETTVVNAAYPDGVNVVLARAGLGTAAVGIGNADLVVPALRQVAARSLGVPMRDVTVSLCAHHFHAFNIIYSGTTHGVPFAIRVESGGVDRTKEVDVSALLRDVPDTARLPQGAAATHLVAGSACRVILGLLGERETFTHAPGPLGHPGGYPVALSRRGVRLALPSDVPIARAIEYNEAGQRAEGIEQIEADGTVVFTETACRVMKEVVGFECRRMPVAAVDTVARELAAKLRELGERFGRRLQVH